MTLRIDECDELLLSRLLDGELTEPEAAELRARLESEPALRAAHLQLQRINGLLVARAVEQAAPRWELFHSRVMNQVEAEPAIRARRTLRFPTWLRVAAPVAAAACVVWMFSMHAIPGAKPGPAGAGAGAIEVVLQHPPAPAAGGTLNVRYHRPMPGGERVTQDSLPVNVAYERSAQMDEQIRKIDAARQKQPSWRLYMVHTDTPSPSLPFDYLGLPPL